MKRTIIFSLMLALAACNPVTQVLTVDGGRIQGVPTNSPGVIVYRGIPYAAPPVGELRWKAPQSVEPWEGVRVCDSWGAPSWQNPHTPGGYTDEFFADGDPAFSEDCLYLNVWTPAPGQRSRNLPVTLWIHGGGFVAGWGHEPEMDGESWARHGGVLVTFNYRLGVLGFMSHPALSEESPDGVSGNYGLMDQIAALEWVKRNIAEFGGDPNHITVMGQSAGAKSVMNVVSSPLSRDLVAGAIIQSGGGISDKPILNAPTLEEAQAQWKEVMDWAGYTTLEQMRAASPEDLLNINWKYAAETGAMPAGTRPVLDDYALEENFAEAVLAGHIADVPYMIGGTLDDMAGLADGIDRFCLEREKAGTPAYAYQFARRLPTDGRPDVLEGAFHSSELWYMFNSLDLCWRPFTDGDYSLADEMITRWTNFAACGNPNGDGPETWTPCTAEDPSFMIFALDGEDHPACRMGAPLKE